uniref:Uncharacterized protein n=1 Tax=Anser cygnoides TaxID=8845 RepID=A0A8B9DCG6_ANSCY
MACPGALLAAHRGAGLGAWAGERRQDPAPRCTLCCGTDVGTGALSPHLPGRTDRRPVRQAHRYGGYNQEGDFHSAAGRLILKTGRKFRLLLLQALKFQHKPKQRHLLYPKEYFRSLVNSKLNRNAGLLHGECCNRLTGSTSLSSPAFLRATC